MIPESSFSGHLSGIIAGLLYTKGRLPEVIERIHEFVFANRRNRGNGRGQRFFQGTIGDYDDQFEEGRRVFQPQRRTY